MIAVTDYSRLELASRQGPRKRQEIKMTRDQIISSQGRLVVHEHNIGEILECGDTHFWVLWHHVGDRMEHSYNGPVARIMTRLVPDGYEPHPATLLAVNSSIRREIAIRTVAEYVA